MFRSHNIKAVMFKQEIFTSRGHHFDALAECMDHFGDQLIGQFVSLGYMFGENEDEFYEIDAVLITELDK